MSELLPQPKGTPGRKRTVTAKAWISRRVRGGVFQSNVSLGDGRIYVLETATRRRCQALEFNRAHLLSKLLADTTAAVSSTFHQPMLIE